MRRLLVVLIVFAGCVSYTPRPVDPADTAKMLQSRSLGSVELRTYAEKSLHRSFDSWPPATVDLDLLTASSLLYNPEVAIARAEAATARAAILTSHERANPTASASVEHKSSGPALSPWVTNFGIDFPFELPPKRRARIAQAAEEASAADARVALAAWNARRRLRTSLVNLFIANQREEAIRRQTEIQKDVVELFTKRVEAGEAAQLELTRARIAAAQSSLLLYDARRAAATARIDVASAAGLSPHALDDVSIDMSSLTSPLPPIDISLRDAALLGRPDILAALHEYAARDAALRLEVARQYPDIHLGPAFGWDQGDRLWAIGTSAEIPLFNRHRGPIAEAVARRDEAAARLFALQTGIISSWDSALARLRIAQEKLAEAERILKDEEQQLAITKRQFDAGELDRLAMRSSELETELARSARLDALFDVQEAAGDIEDAMQRPLVSTIAPAEESK